MLRPRPSLPDRSSKLFVPFSSVKRRLPLASYVVVHGTFRRMCVVLMGTTPRQCRIDFPLRDCTSCVLRYVPIANWERSELPETT